MTAIDCGTIYKITSPTSRVYIGQTTRPVEKRWEEYKKLNKCKDQTKLYNSLKKYGYENHVKEVIITGITSKEMLDSYEMFYITLYDSTGENGLNCTLGGDGYLKPENELTYGMRHCGKEYNKARYEAHKEEIKAYRDAHKEEIKVKNKAYKDAHKEEIKAQKKVYNEAHKEEIKAKNKAYRDTHKEEIKAQRKAYNETHKEEIKAKTKAYKDTHKEEIKAYMDAHKEEIKAYKEREKAIKKHFGYNWNQWRALPADMRAQMRAKYEEETKQTTLF